MFSHLFILVLLCGFTQLQATEIDPRLKELNEKLINWGLEHLHRVEYQGGNQSWRDAQPVDVATHASMPFDVFGSRKTNNATRLEIKPLGMQSIYRNIFFSMYLELNSSERLEWTGKNSGKNKALERELMGLVPDPVAFIFVSLSLEFERDWTVVGDQTRDFGPAPNTVTQILRMLRADLALARVRHDLANPNITMEPGLLMGGHRARSGTDQSLGLGPSVSFRLNVPPGVPVLRAYVAFYKYLFEGLLRPTPLELPPPPSNAQRTLTGIISLFSRKRDHCTMSLDTSKVDVPKLSSPPSQELTLVQKRDVLLGANETIVTIETPLGPIDVLVNRLKHSH